jgi:hypothetical protein
MPGRARALARLSVHPRPEISEPFLGDPLVGSRDSAGVLLEAMEEDDEVAGALVQEALSGIREPNP